MIATKEGGLTCAAVIAVAAVLGGVVGFGTPVAAAGAAAVGLSAVANSLYDGIRY